MTQLKHKTMAGTFAHPTLQLVPPGKRLDMLLDGVGRGVKTATTALEISFAMRGLPLPTVSDKYTLLDSNDEAFRDIEVTQVRHVRLADVGIDVATAEGDWFDSVSQWRSAHEKFFNESAAHVADYLTVSDWAANDDTMVIVRFFRVLN